MVRDITERKCVEKDLAESHPKLRNLAEHLLEKMRKMISLTDQTSQRVQRISSELRPRMLDDLGLTAAIEWLVGDFSRRTGIRCKTAVQVTESRIGGNSVTAIYRIVQEALTNISRHASASRVSVLLRDPSASSGSGRGFTGSVEKCRLAERRGRAPPSRFPSRTREEEIWHDPDSHS